MNAPRGAFLMLTGYRGRRRRPCARWMWRNVCVPIGTHYGVNTSAPIFDMRHSEKVSYMTLFRSLQLQCLVVQQEQLAAFWQIARRSCAVCQVGDLFGLNTGRGLCRGPCRRVSQLRLGEPQCLGRHLQILRVSDPHIAGMTSRAAAGAATRVQTEQPGGLAHCAAPPRSCPTP
jgi:hypothetical protein